MPRFFFHSANHARDPDEERTELANDEEAQRMAVAFAGEVLRDDPNRLRDRGAWRVEVTDESNALLFTVITMAVDASRPGRKPSRSG